MTTENDLVTVGRFSTLPEMDMARGLLESEGIETLAPEEHLVAVYGRAVGWIRLQVRGEDAERAKALLESGLSEEHSGEEDEEK